MPHRPNLFICILALAALLSGCATPPIKVGHPAVPEDYAGKVGTGTATLSGEAFGKTRGGDVKPGAGCTVHLDPVTPYSTELFELIRKQRESLRDVQYPTTPEYEKDAVDIDPLMLRCRRNALADSTGRFRFSNVLDGDYYVSCYISWMTYRGFWTGGWRFAKVKLSQGETKDVVLQ